MQGQAGTPRQNGGPGRSKVGVGIGVLLLLLVALFGRDRLGGAPTSVEPVRATQTTLQQAERTQAPARATRQVEPTQTPGRATRTVTRRATQTTAPVDTRNASGMQIVAAETLPPEAQATLKLIERGGPFPYRQDGVTFGNRERLLPSHPNGYYREYTVRTPGADDRGARRIVAGKGGELYYTDDHYASFAEVRVR